MSTQLKLDSNVWDLKLVETDTGKKNLQLVNSYDATAQRVACNLRTIQGENPFFKSLGLPWFSGFFRDRLNDELSKVQEYIIRVVTETEGVNTVTLYQTRQEGRHLVVSMQIQAISGQIFTIEENLT